MTERPQEQYSENVDKSNTPLPNSHAAKLFKESSDAMTDLVGLSHLLLVVDLYDFTPSKDADLQSLSWGFQALGKVLMRLALQAQEKLDRAQEEWNTDLSK